MSGLISPREKLEADSAKISEYAADFNRLVSAGKLNDAAVVLNRLRYRATLTDRVLMNHYPTEWENGRDALRGTGRNPVIVREL